MTPRAFTDIDTWVFDLDNTLYPHHVNLWQQVDVRIGEFVAACLRTKFVAGNYPNRGRMFFRRQGNSGADRCGDEYY